ncbi:hypothetical protein J6590_042733 [Homalodisca vitripennis]|nr:hypothetical protein J6590_042733 [Homalodisca vitripennis]
MVSSYNHRNVSKCFLFLVIRLEPAKIVSQHYRKATWCEIKKPKNTIVCRRNSKRMKEKVKTLLRHPLLWD